MGIRLTSIGPSTTHRTVRTWAETVRVWERSLASRIDVIGTALAVPGRVNGVGLAWEDVNQPMCIAERGL